MRQAISRSDEPRTSSSCRTPPPSATWRRIPRSPTRWSRWTTPPSSRTRRSPRRSSSDSSTQMGRVTARRPACHLTADAVTTRPETLAVEEPLELRVNGSAVTVTMRTPGADIELAQGFLLTEGVIARREDVLTIRYCAGRGEDGGNTYNVLGVTLAPGVEPPDLNVTRNFYTTSSCGVCGKASLDAVRVISKHGPGDDPSMVAAETLPALRAHPPA